MSSHVTHVGKCCYFHIRCLEKIQNLLTKIVANAIAVSKVTSRLDYDNDKKRSRENCLKLSLFLLGNNG